MNWREHKKRLLKDPEFKKEYEALCVLDEKEMTAREKLDPAEVKILKIKLKEEGI